VKIFSKHAAVTLFDNILWTVAVALLLCFLPSSRAAAELVPKAIVFFGQGYEHSAGLLERSSLEAQHEKTNTALWPGLDLQLMIRALEHYQRIALQGGWPAIAPGRVMKRGFRDRRIPLLRWRLRLTGDLGSMAEQNSDLYDASLERAVKIFQMRHGLEADGVVGPATLKALNVPVEKRIEQIGLNLERLRSFLSRRRPRFLLVNSASSELKVIEQDRSILEMKAVVGRPDRATPICQSVISYLEFNPYWYVPPTILREDILPAVEREPDYLKRHRLRVFEINGKYQQELDPDKIDWALFRSNMTFYKIRQDPGPWNALGRIKFIFPNRFGVYIHDTPARQLFNKSQRHFSSGCVRVERPVDLAEYLLRGDRRWTRSRILATINKVHRRVVRLPEPMPVFLVYWTAWMAVDGRVNFRDDIYGRDRLLARSRQNAEDYHASVQISCSIAAENSL